MSKSFYSTPGSFAVLILVLASVDYSSAANCDAIVVKETEGVLNWLGNVTFTVPQDASGWIIVLRFDQAYTGVGVWTVWGRYDDKKQSVELTPREENYDLKQGDILTFRFRVNYGRDIPQPKVISLRFQDIEMCA